jgi:hypothetical protein
MEKIKMDDDFVLPEDYQEPIKVVLDEDEEDDYDSDDLVGELDFDN